MFDQLVSSKVKRQAAPVRSLLVGMVHGILIAGAIRVTARAPQAAAADPLPITIVYEHHPTHVTTTAPLDPSTATERIEAPALPPAPVDVPVDIPPVAPGPVVDPNMLRHILSTGTPGSNPGRGDSVSIRGVLAATEVDDPAVVVHQPSPRYPPVLQQAGIEGRVLLEFIIDTAGHMESTSLRVLESSNRGFDSVAGETIRRSVFRPARVHGSPVRQRTIQSVVFRIAPE